MPRPAQREKSHSLWSIIKEAIGKDLSKVCLPVYFNEPLSALQKSSEDLEYCELLDKVSLHIHFLSAAGLNSYMHSIMDIMLDCLCLTASVH